MIDLEKYINNFKDFFRKNPYKSNKGEYFYVTDDTEEILCRKCTDKYFEEGD